MGQLVFIIGRPGTGKSYSMRNFPKGKLAVINVQGKILPFKGSGEIEMTSTDRSERIVQALDIYSKKFKSIVVDDFQYTMANEFMRRSAEKGYDKFTEIGRHAWDIASKVTELPADVIVYVMCHTDRDDEGNEKIKTIGKLLDEKICLEGMSTIVLKTNVADGVYTFLTQNNGKDTVKSPADMFPTYAIDNDLYYVDQKIRSYYGLGEHVSDEDIAKMDETAKNEEIAKPEERKSRRARRGEAKEEKPADAPEEEKEASGEAEQAAPETDEADSTAGVNEQIPLPVDEEPEEKPEELPRRKSRRAKTEEPVEEQLETSALATEDKPRRRKRKTEISDDDLPFTMNGK